MSRKAEILLCAVALCTYCLEPHVAKQDLDVLHDWRTGSVVEICNSAANMHA